MPPATDLPAWPYQVIEAPSGLAIHHRGPSLEQGPLPALFYFALTGEESLNLDPFNQPVMFLGKELIRAFSFTLPRHGPLMENRQSVTEWSREIAANRDFVAPFIDSCIENIDFLISEGYIDDKKLGAAGLSRGGFMAAHLAARDKRIKNVLGFAPITELGVLEDFKDLQQHPLVIKLSLSHLLKELSDKHLRFYVGNRDVRVKTLCCFQFIHNLADTAYHQGHRSPPIELVSFPSVGYKGHGTPPYIFQDGARWIKSLLIE